MIKASYKKELLKTLLVIFLFGFLFLCFYLYKSMPRGFTCKSYGNEKTTYFQGRFIPLSNTLLIDHHRGFTEFKCEKTAVLSCVEMNKNAPVSDGISLNVYRMNFSMVLKGKEFGVATAECMWDSDLKI